ncbi:hypothetical protein HU200_062456 [Digitaria exilis]|uniref:F-box domain-containing protein n=1 Tax=Digitaria exilis TaxID=1010633 RepID=A0A835A5R9_9POAL|nr:hypothetical protein HU200_062456 [Digitaria exilis]
MGNHIHKAWRKERGIREPPDLPLEILLDIFARADPATVIRCAATSKLLRRHITNPSFHQHLRKNHAVGFVPALLVGVLFFDAREGQGRRQFVPLPPSTKLTLSLAPANGGDGSCRRYTFRPVASRDGLVVLSRYKIVHGVTVVELCVGNPVTGEYAFLPPATVSRTGYSHVLLTGDQLQPFLLPAARLGHGGSHANFLVKNRRVGPSTEPFAHLNLPDGSTIARCSAVVLRGVAHWLYEYKYNDDDNTKSSHGYGVVAITIAGAGTAATAIEIPRHCLRWRRCEVKEELLLARSADGRLALLVAESLGTAMWTLSKDSTSWARRLVVNRQRILGSVKLRWDPIACVGTELDWFGEASGTVAFQVNGAGMLLLNLKTREISQFSQGLTIRRRLRWCPYEMDLVSVLAAMKSF